ncbi:ABC transporter permease [Treponema pectinovorum]|uniref:ABC transporter permease n=1 Tax=Treponema pectinovorum TaxID=164 RepID=UPI0011CC687E|nr:iron ABC transporter permease [Treponema pectinovorum]
MIFLKALSIFFENRFTSIAFFTIVQALLSTLVAVAVWLFSAFFVAKKNFSPKKIFILLSAVPLCIPSLLIALGYVSFFGISGSVNRIFMYVTGNSSPPITFLYSFWGIIICHGFYNFPLVMSTVASNWERLPQEEEQAARLLGANSFKIFKTITIYKLMPSLVSACIPVFLYCFFSFMIVLLFGSIGTTTLEVEIFQLAKVNLDFYSAFRLATAETSIALIFVFAYTFLEQKSSALKGISFSSENSKKEKLNAPEKIIAIAFFATIAIFFLGPLFSIFINGFMTKQKTSILTLSNFIYIFRTASFWNAIKWTVLTSTLAGFFCALTAFLYAIILRKFDRNGKLFIFRIIPIIPMAISSVVTGLILTAFIKKGNFLILVLAQTALNWPIAFRQIFADFSKLKNTTEDAAKLLSKKNSQIIFKIYLPICKKAFFRSAGFCFALSAGDATLPLVLSIPKFDTLSLYIYRLAGTYKFHQACATGSILALMCTTVFYLSRKKERN